MKKDQGGDGFSVKLIALSLNRSVVGKGSNFIINYVISFIYFCRGIMKMILNLFTSDNELMVKSAIYVLCKIIRSEPMRNSWMQFLELIILKIIDSYRISRDVSQRIDATIPQIAKNLPLDLTLNILYPVIATGEYPTNFAALKMLLELADKQGHLLTEQHLETIMPCLARVSKEFLGLECEI